MTTNVLRKLSSYYSTWSCAVTLLCVLVLSVIRFTKNDYCLSPTITQTLITTSITVGVVGAFVIAHFRMESSPHVQLTSNFYIHAFPSFLASLMLMHRNKYSVTDTKRTLSFLTVIQIIYLLVPFKGNNGINKLRQVYNVEPVAICLLFLIVQFYVLYLLTKRKS